MTNVGTEMSSRLTTRALVVEELALAEARRSRPTSDAGDGLEEQGEHRRAGT